MQRAVKTSTLPSLRVDPELREAAEGVLRDGETLTSLIESAVRDAIDRRRTREAFIARGLRSAEDARQTGIYHPAGAVHDELQARLDVRRLELAGPTRRR